MNRAVQSLWIGDTLSTMGRLTVRSFLAHGVDFHFYCYGHVAGVPEGAHIKDASEILPRDQVHPYHVGFGTGSYSLGSNYFRYKLLLDRGGWWVDTDVICIKPFDFEAPSIIASEMRDPDEGGGTGPASAIMRQPAGSALMQWAWQACLERDPHSVQWGEVGPRLVQRAVEALGWQAHLVPPAVFSPVPYYDWRRFIDPADAIELPPDTHAVHLFHQMWRAGGADPEADFHPSCFYERMKRQFGVR